MSARRRLWVVVLALVIVAVAVVGGLVWLARPTPAPEGETAWEQVLDRIGPEGDVDFETALQAFTIAFGPLPGVATPPGRQTVVASGTGALRWLQGYRDRLTPDQLAAVDGYLTPTGPTFRLEPDATGFVEAENGSTRLIAGVWPAELPGVPAAHALSGSDYMALIVRFRDTIAGLLHRKLPFAIDVHVNDTQKGNDLAYTEPDFGLLRNGPASGCEITINPSLTNDPEPAATAASMAHEVFHCFQSVLFVGSAAWNSAHEARPWLIEGSAEWVGEALGGPSHLGLAWWERYLRHPDWRLFSRGYDAVGFYQHMAEQRIDPWTVFDKMFVSSNVAAYRMAIAPPSAQFEDTWGSGVWRDTAVGGAWLAQGAWTTTASAPVGHQNVAEGATETLDTEPFTTGGWEVTTDAPILHVEPHGSVRLGSGTSFDFVARTGLDLCMDGAACACPQGRHYVGPSLVSVNQPLRVGLTGGEPAATLAMTGQGLDELCVPDASGSPPATAGRGPSGPQCLRPCGGSNGDPHIRTIDGHAYDFQAAGEFVLLRAPDETFEVQARQEPYPTKDWVSINTAVAARVNGHRVGIYVDEEGFHMLIDGQPANATGPTDLGGGALAWPDLVSSDGMAVEFGDGTTLWAISTGSYGINAILSPSEALRGSGAGILGPVAAGGLGLPDLPDGSALPATTDRHERYGLVYGRFADAWRVTAQSSLFDYEAGLSSADYALPDFPIEAHEVTLADLTPEQLAAGAAACGEISDPLLRDQCIFDVSVTGAAQYAALYALTQSVMQKGADAAPPAPGPVPTAGALPGDPPIHEVTTVGLVRGAATGPDGLIYLSVLQGDAGEVLRVDPQSASVTERVATAWAGRVAFVDGALWVGDMTSLTSCSISRLDPATLVVEATYPTVCGTFGTQFVAVGDAIWWADATGTDANGVGGHLQRLDPASGTSSEVAASPYAFGTLASSASAIFLTDSAGAVHRLRPGESSFTLVTTERAQWFPSGDGLWRQEPVGRAVFVDGTPEGDRSISIGGSLVAAWSDALYADVLDVTGVITNTLQRYPQDGSSASLLFSGGTTQVDGATRIFDYATAGPLLIDAVNVTEFWTFPRADRTGNDLFLQSVAQP